MSEKRDFLVFHSVLLSFYYPQLADQPSASG